jgi:cysteine protease ATG4
LKQGCVGLPAKALFTFPQSVGIAGGRPSSSYYFVASQAGSLFYLDPHITRAAIPLEIPPVPTKKAESPAELMLDDEEAVVIDELAVAEGAVDATYTLDVVNVDDLSSDSESSLSPTRRTAHKLKAAKRLSAPPRGSLSGGATGTELDTTILPSRQPDVFDDFTSTPQHGLPAMARRPSATPSNDRRFAVDPETAWYAAAYSTAQLRTFHCEKVKKMPLSGLDPSMLLGFLCRDEAEFEDFCERAVKVRHCNAIEAESVQLPQKIFSIQDEPPIWDEDDDAGLESVSEPDVDELSDIEPPEEEEEVVGAELAGSNSAVAAEPVDIPHLRSLKINTSDITSAKYGKPAENEEADWDETIAERSDALSSQPVLVSRGFPDMPINAIPRPNSSGWAHGGKPVVPELGRARERMESWVQPEKEGQAPNGGAMGGALLKYE